MIKYLKQSATMKQYRVISDVDDKPAELRAENEQRALEIYRNLYHKEATGITILNEIII